MRKTLARVMGLILLVPLHLGAHAQAPAAPGNNPIDARLEGMSKLLAATQQQLEQTQQQLDQLRAELEQLRTQKATAADPALQPSKSAGELADEVERQAEQQEILDAEVKQHDQTKLESLSKYPVRVYGLLLFSAYSNAGIVDNPDLPSVALARTPGQSHGSIGGSFRQTLLGLTASGPRIFGARSSADLSIDFFGDSAYNYYASTNGSVRLRRGDVRLEWGEGIIKSSHQWQLDAGIDGPLISPLSPTSFATVAIPAMAWSGNLWNWAPELQFKYTARLSSHDLFKTVQLQGGLWDPPVAGAEGSSPARVVSAGELSRRPGYLARTSIHGGPDDHAFAIGLGAFSDRQTSADGQQIQLWAISSDWQIPVARRFELEGEMYRGRGLGGLGGGAYKDALSGIDIKTGLSRTLGLNAAGGWAQFKARFSRNSEGNLSYGQDGGFARDFHQLTLSATPYFLERSARSQTIVTNYVYRPRTYLLFSPEYRRLRSWDITGPASVANIYNLSVGFQF